MPIYMHYNMQKNFILRALLYKPLHGTVCKPLPYLRTMSENVGVTGRGGHKGQLLIPNIPWQE